MKPKKTLGAALAACALYGVTAHAASDAPRKMVTYSLTLTKGGKEIATRMGAWPLGRPQMFEDLSVEPTKCHWAGSDSLTTWEQDLNYVAGDAFYATVYPVPGERGVISTLIRAEVGHGNAEPAVTFEGCRIRPGAAQIYTVVDTAAMRPGDTRTLSLGNDERLELKLDDVSP